MGIGQYGSLIGGGLGMAFGGPIGGALGSALGGAFGGGDDDDAMKDMIRLIQQNTAAAEKDYKPYLTGGQSAQEQMMAQMGLGGPAKAFDVTQLPGYQNALQQGLSAVNQGGAGAGMLMSGERLKGLQSTGQNIFGDYYNNYMNRLSGMSQMGYGAAGNLSSIRSGGTAQHLGLLQQQQQQNADRSSDLMGLGGSLSGMIGGMFPEFKGVLGGLGGMQDGGYTGGYPTGAMKIAGIDF